MSFLCRGSERRWLLVLALIALTVRLVWALAMTDRVPLFDEAEYVGHAARLAAGEGFVDEGGTPVAYWPVGYPAVLSLLFRLVGPSAAAAVALQIGLSVASCLLLSVVGSRILDPRSGRLAGLLLAVYPNFVMYSTLRLTEPLFVLLLLGAASVLMLGKMDRLGWQVAAGLLLGLAALTRPLIVLLPLVLPLALRFRQGSMRRALTGSVVVGCTALVTISPWLWRNHELTGRWTTLTTSGGYNFWVGNNVAARGGYIRSEGVEHLFEDVDGYDWRRGYSLGWGDIRENPARALWRIPLKISHLVALETDGALWNLKGLDRAPPMPWVLGLLLIANLPYLALLATASWALTTRSDGGDFERVTVVLCGYVALIVMVFFGDPRFHLPLVPFLLLLSASVIVADRPCLRSSGRLWAWAGLMTGLGVLMVVNLAIKYSEGAW